MDDIQVTREITLEADAESLERMRKEGHARGFTVYCDEGKRSFIMLLVVLRLVFHDILSHYRVVKRCSN